MLFLFVLKHQRDVVETVQQPPDDEGPVCAVPESAGEHGDQRRQNDRCQLRPASLHQPAARGEENVVA